MNGTPKTNNDKSINMSGIKKRPSNSAQRGNSAVKNPNSNIAKRPAGQTNKSGGAKTSAAGTATRKRPVSAQGANAPVFGSKSAVATPRKRPESATVSTNTAKRNSAQTAGKTTRKTSNNASGSGKAHVSPSKSRSVKRPANAVKKSVNSIKSDTKGGAKKTARTRNASGKKTATKIAKKNTRKNRKDRFTYSTVLRGIIPWKGDSWFNIMRKTVFDVSLVIFSICLFSITNYYAENNINKDLYAELEWQYGKSSTDTTQAVAAPGDPEWRVPLLPMRNAKTMLATNSDYVGFITIDGTKISYPIVQKQSESGGDGNSYYLTTSFDGSANKAGTLFLDYRNFFDRESENYRVQPNSGNQIIYGHEMKDGQMFGTLKQYVNNHSWYGKHPIIQLDSVYQQYKYKIFAVCIVDVKKNRTYGKEDVTDVFNYFNTIDFADSTAFYEYVNGCKRRSYIDNKVDVRYGDELLTLSTCNEVFEDARLIVVARKMRPGESDTEGVEGYTQNKNRLMPKIWYKYDGSSKFNENLFVPYPFN